MSRTTERYHPTLITLHWLTLLLMVGVYALIELHDGLPKGSTERALAKSWHESLGILVFAVVVLVRLPLRWMLGQPSELAGTPAWQSRLAHVMHWALYGLLIAAPVLGYLSLNAKGAPVSLFGLELPGLMAPDKALAGGLKEVHEAIGTLGYWLIGLHAAAALVHHYLMHDTTLARMGLGRARLDPNSRDSR